VPNRRSPAGDGQPLTLVIDTNAHAARQLAAQLAHAGFPSRAAATRLAAVDVATAQYFRSIVVAVELDDAESRNFLRTISRVAPRSWLVVISSIDDPAASNLAQKCGGDALITVPFAVEDLATRLAAFSSRERPV
jgi:DNA-binding response OmpR family regulator